MPKSQPPPPPPPSGKRRKPAGRPKSATAGTPSPGMYNATQDTLSQGSGQSAAHGAAVPLTGRFGRYEIQRILGEGGMGAVYLAIDTTLNRPVALKVPKWSKDSEAAIARFYREARALATLHHPNICPVYDVGQENGRHYISMAYIEGVPLSDYVSPEKPLPQQQVVRLVRKLARALSEAHAAGIVHRDLKAANVLVDRRGEPIVMDFGLALIEDGDVRVTQSGMMLGTPAYMSPEQIMGKLDEVGPQSDLFSLGVILFELLTGQLPFEGPATSVIGQILTVEPPAPCSLRPDLDPGLQHICLTMMAKQPGDRYRDMQTAYAALTTWLRTGQAPSSDQSLLEPESLPQMALPTLRTNRDHAPAATEAGSAPVSLPGGAGISATRVEPSAPKRKRTRRKKKSAAAGSNVPLILTMVGCTAVVVFVVFSLIRDRGGAKDHSAAVTAPAQTAGSDEIQGQSSTVENSQVANASGSPNGVDAEGTSARQSGQPYPGRSPSKPSSSMVDLFNGKDLTGWTTIGSTTSFWSARDGAITLTQPVSRGWLSTVVPYTDFELSLDYRLPPGGNTGVFLRSPWTGDHVDSERLEIQILDDGHPRYFGLPDDRKNGAVYGVIPQRKPVRTPPREWHRLWISLRGSRILVRVNGETTVDDDLSRYSREINDRGIVTSRPGYIGFQAYGYPPEFRNIRLREL